MEVQDQQLKSLRSNATNLSLGGSLAGDELSAIGEQGNGFRALARCQFNRDSPPLGAAWSECIDFGRRVIAIRLERLSDGPCRVGGRRDCVRR